MDLRSSRAAVAHVLFATIGVGLSVERWFAHEHSGALAVAEAGLPLALGLGVAYAGVRFAELSPSTSQVYRSGAVLCVGCLYGAGFVAFVQIVQSVGGGRPVHSRFLILVGGLGGVALATVIAHYYVAYAVRLAEAREQSERARTLRKQVSVLNRILRHNIRNELSMIEGWLDETGGGTGDAVAARRKVERHLAELEELSETARQIQGVLETDERTALDVTNCVEREVTEISTAHPPVDVRTDVPESATALAHPEFDAALAETLKNAVEHNDPAELTVRVSATPVERDRRWLRVQVSDTGDGIPPMEIESLERPAETPLRHGAGLGLYLVKTIVDQSGGEFEVASDEAGTTVRMWLPAVEDSSAG